MPDDDPKEIPTVPPIPTPEGPATTGTYRKAYQDIGPVFRFAGVLLLTFDFALVGLDLKTGNPLGWPDVALHVVLALAAMLLIRPPGFDEFVKTIADRLPFLNYRKPPE